MANKCKKEINFEFGKVTISGTKEEVYSFLNSISTYAYETYFRLQEMNLNAIAKEAKKYATEWHDICEEAGVYKGL